MNVADTLGRFVDPISRWRRKHEEVRLLRFLLSGSQVIYQYPRFRRVTDLVARGIGEMRDWVRFGANCVLI